MGLILEALSESVQPLLWQSGGLRAGGNVRGGDINLRDGKSVSSCTLGQDGLIV